MLVMVACGGGKKEKVKSFADTFAGYVNAGQLDSIKAVYPSVNFDSVAHVSTDSVKISDTDGITRVDFGGGKWIELEIGDSGDITVVNSKGIAAFPEDKFQLAVNTGMLNNSTADIKTQELLNDSIYLAWLNDKAVKEIKESLIFSRGNIIRTIGHDTLSDIIIWPVTVTNKENSTISGSSYNVITRWFSYWGDGNPGKGTKITIKGEDLTPGETKTFTFKQKAFALNPPTLEYNISNKDFILKNYKFTGKEYQEYLDSKK